MTASVCQPMRRPGFEAESCGPAKQVRALKLAKERLQPQTGFQHRKRIPNSLMWLVGARGFEPRTSCAQGKRATRLRHAPKWNTISFCQASFGVSSANHGVGCCKGGPAAASISERAGIPLSPKNALPMRSGGESTPVLSAVHKAAPIWRPGV